MNYASPIRLFDYCQIERNQLNEDNISRIKKILQAEFMMASNGILEVNGYSYNKNDVFELLNDPQFLFKIKDYLRIDEDKVLLNFLEEGKLLPEEVEHLVFRYQGDEGILNIIAPPLASSLDTILKKELSLFNLEIASNYFKLDVLVSYQEEENAYNSTRKFLEEQLYFFRNINQHNVKTKKEPLKEWTRHNWSLFINTLPDYLYIYIDRLAGHIIDFMVTVQYVENRLCYKFSKELIQVNMSPELMQIANKNHKVFKKRRFSFFFQIGKKRMHFKPGSVWFIIVFGNIILKIATCDTESAHSDNNIFPQYDNNNKQIQSELKKLDSTRKKTDSIHFNNKHLFSEPQKIHL